MLAPMSQWILAALAVGVTACMPHPQEPEHVLRLVPQPEVAGNVKVTVANDLIGFEKGAYLCDLRLSSGGPPGPNLLPEGMFTSGISVDTGLRPGRYTFEATTCAGEKHAASFTLDGPTTIHVGYGEGSIQPKTDGAQVWLAFGVSDTARELAKESKCIADNDWSPVTNISCCDPQGRTHWSREAGRLVCGP